MIFPFKKKNDKKYHCVLSDIEKAQLNMEGLVVIDADKSSGYWVKQVHHPSYGNYVFLLVSDSVTTLLHGKRGFSCIGKTDHCVALEAGVMMSEEQFANVCRGSDNLSVKYYEQHGINRKVYIEFIQGALGDNDLHIWKTTKTIIELNGNMYIYGKAEFLDITKGSYENALKYVENEKESLEKINDFLYIYK